MKSSQPRIAKIEAADSSVFDGLNGARCWPVVLGGRMWLGRCGDVSAHNTEKFQSITDFTYVLGLQVNEK